MHLQGTAPLLPVPVAASIPTYPGDSSCPATGASPLPIQPHGLSRSFLVLIPVYTRPYPGVHQRPSRSIPGFIAVHPGLSWALSRSIPLYPRLYPGPSRSIPVCPGAPRPRTCSVAALPRMRAPAAPAPPFCPRAAGVRGTLEGRSGSATRGESGRKPTPGTVQDGGALEKHSGDELRGRSGPIASRRRRRHLTSLPPRPPRCRAVHPPRRLTGPLARQSAASTRAFPHGIG